MTVQVQAKPAPKPSFTPPRTNLLQRTCACGGTPSPYGERTECRKKRLGLQRKATNHVEPSTVPSIVHEVLRSPGQPLDPTTRAFMEPRFGHNFSRVRVHTDAKAAESARAVGALAYTVGRDVVFGAGQHASGTEAGKKLLAHELAHVIQQGTHIRRLPDELETTSPGDAAEREAEEASRTIAQRRPSSLTLGGPPQVARQVPSIKVSQKARSTFIQRSPISPELRRRIELCVDPFYYDEKGRYTWSLDPRPDCSDMVIPADRERAWKCLNGMYWSRDGRTWKWFDDPEPVCSDLRLPVPLFEFRGETPETRARREAAERRRAIVERNRARISALRDRSPTDVEALARMFTNPDIVDDGTIPGRVSAILDATEHRLIPGLHTGVEFEQSGFRAEFHDPWKSSINQVGHFLTAVRLAFDPGFLNNPILLIILNAWGDRDVPLRLIIGHEKEPDPSVFSMSVGFRAQYRATTAEDIANFRAGNLEAIRVGTGRGNSMADLRLSYKGWILGRWIAEGRFGTREEIARWIRRTIGTLKE